MNKIPYPRMTSLVKFSTNNVAWQLSVCHGNNKESVTKIIAPKLLHVLNKINDHMNSHSFLRLPL